MFSSLINRYDSAHGILRFLLFSHLSHVCYVWKSSIWIGIFQRATQRPRLQLTDNIQRGGRWSVNYYWLRACIVCVEQNSRKLSKSCIELECMPFLSIKDSKPPRTHALGSDSLYYNKNTETQDHKTVRGSGGMGKFVSALCLQSCFWNLLGYAINCVYTRGVVLLGLNLQNLSLSDCLLKLLWPSAIL